MVHDHLLPFIVHPITHEVVTTEERKLLELEYYDPVSAPVHALCEIISCQMHLGFKIVYLRKVFQFQTSFGQVKDLVLFEVHPESTDLTLPFGLIWTPKHETRSVLGLPTSSMVSKFLLEYSKSGLDSKEQVLYPYSRAGWFRRAKEWMSSNLERYEQEKVMAVNQVTLNSQGSVLRATTRSNRKYFLKAVPPNGMNEEVVVSCALANVFPDVFRKPIAVHNGKRWILMSDYGTPLGHGECFMSSDTGSERMRNILQEWSVVQKRAIEKKDVLTHLGVPVWGESFVLQEVQKMMDDPVWYNMQKTRMNEEERLRYGDELEYKKNYIAYIKRLFGRLKDFDVPLSLVHGDLNPVNVVMRDNQTCIFFDFSLTCISAPFIDAIRFVNLCEGRKEDLEFYLEQWTEFESMDRLWKLLDIVDDLDGVLSRLILYQGYLTSEEFLRDATREELSFGVCNTFGKYA